MNTNKRTDTGGGSGGGGGGKYCVIKQSFINNVLILITLLNVSSLCACMRVCVCAYTYRSLPLPPLLSQNLILPPLSYFLGKGLTH